MEKNPYPWIKEMFKNVLDKPENYQDIKISNYKNKKDYLLDIYNKVTEDKYSQERKMSMSLMELGRTAFDELMLETNCANLYSYLTVIMQNIKGRGIRREGFLDKMHVTESDNKNCVARFRKRLQPDRLNSTKHVTTIVETPCYIPTLLKAYKDIFFIPRQDTDVFDISPYYIDIFTALMFDTDEQNKDKNFLRSRDIIKSHSLWNLSHATVKHIESIYNSILDTAEEDNKFLELHFMEKLFGILTADEILKLGRSKEETLKIAGCISTLRELGLSRLNKEIIKRVTTENARVYERIVSEYIDPVCIGCLRWYLNDIITYMGIISKDNRGNFLMNLRTICKKFISYKLPMKVSMDDTADSLKSYKEINIDSNLIISILIELQGIQTTDSSPEIYDYLMTKHSPFFDCGDPSSEKISLTYDCDFTELTFPKWYEEDSDEEECNLSFDDDCENDFWVNGRIKY